MSRNITNDREEEVRIDMLGDLTQYAVDAKKYPPNKANSAYWTRSLDDDAWLLAHDSILGELQDLEGCCKGLFLQEHQKERYQLERAQERKEKEERNQILQTKLMELQQQHKITKEQQVQLKALNEEMQQATEELEKQQRKTAAQGPENLKLQAWHIKAVQTVWKYHRDHVMKHHDAEENIMLPFLSTRFKFPSHLSSAGHVELQEKVVDIEEMVSNLNVGESIAELAWALSTKYGPCLRDHLQEEETRQNDCRNVGKEMGAKGGHSGGFIYYMGEHRFRTVFMPDHRIPFFVWHVSFAGALKEYQRNVMRHVTALHGKGVNKNRDHINSGSCDEDGVPTNSTTKSSSLSALKL